jgi:hypothetical protein
MKFSRQRAKRWRDSEDITKKMHGDSRIRGGSEPNWIYMEAESKKSDAGTLRDARYLPFDH